MKLFYFGWHEHGTNFAIIPAETKEEAIEKYNEAAKEKDIKEEKSWGRPLGKYEKYSNFPIIEEIEGCIYWDNHD